MTYTYMRLPSSRIAPACGTRLAERNDIHIREAVRTASSCAPARGRIWLHKNGQSHVEPCLLSALTYSLVLYTRFRDVPGGSRTNKGHPRVVPLEAFQVARQHNRMLLTHIKHLRCPSACQGRWCSSCCHQAGQAEAFPASLRTEYNVMESAGKSASWVACGLAAVHFSPCAKWRWKMQACLHGAVCVHGPPPDSDGWLRM